MSTYSEKLKNPKWQRKRLEILQRDDFKCLICNDAETELHVHHLKYTKAPHDAPNEDLQTLCKHCHLIVETLKIDIKNEGTPIAKRFHKKMIFNTSEFTILFNIEDTIDFEKFKAFNKNSPILKYLYESNKSNG